MVTYNTATAVASGWEANLVALFGNGLVQYLKQFRWYNQNVWAFPTLIALGIGVSSLMFPEQIAKIIVTGMNIAGQAWQNFAALKPGPLMPSAPGLPSLEETPSLLLASASVSAHEEKG